VVGAGEDGECLQRATFEPDCRYSYRRTLEGGVDLWSPFWPGGRLLGAALGVEVGIQPRRAPNAWWSGNHPAGLVVYLVGLSILGSACPEGMAA